MLVDVVRFFRGYVAFRASGRFPERFLNITARYGIALWNVRPSDGGIEGAMSVSDYRKIRSTARKSGVRLRITKKHGMPFFAAKYRFRMGIPIGAALGLALMIFLSQFVWSLRIVGADNISETRILKALEANGVKAGAFKGSIDVQQVERSMLLEIDEITWMSVNILGSTATVEVKEKAKKPDIVLNPAPSNIKASCDGVITKINARNGMSQVKVGSGVVKGELLVSGITQTKQNTTRYVHADAEVLADVISNKELTLPKDFDYYSITENKINRSRLHFLWSELPFSLSFGAYDNTAYSESNQNLVLNGNLLPLGIKTETAHEMVYRRATPDAQTAERIFKNSLMLYEVFEKGGSIVKSRDIKAEETKDSFTCTANYVFNENIAETVEFSVTEQ